MEYPRNSRLVWLSVCVQADAVIYHPHGVQYGGMVSHSEYATYTGHRYIGAGVQ
jgi:hypothetical protein